MTLTFELVRDIVKMNPCAKFWVHTLNCSAVRALTNKQTDGTDFMPSTADAGGTREGMTMLNFPFIIDMIESGRKNYSWCAGQNVSPSVLCRTF